MAMSVLTITATQFHYLLQAAERFAAAGFPTSTTCRAGPPPGSTKALFAVLATPVIGRRDSSKGIMR